MPINSKEFQSLQGGVNEMMQQGGANQRASQEAALRQYLQGQEPAIAGQKQTAQNEANLKTMQDPALQGMLQDGGSIAVGDIHAGADPYARAMAQMGNKRSAEAQRIAGYAGKNIKPLEDQLSTLDLYHSMLDNPNAFDQKKLQVLGARLVEGQGQRLLDSVIQAMGANKGTLEGSAQDKLNYMTGAAKSGLTPEQMNAMRESAFKYQDELGPKYEDARNQFNAFAPQLGADIDPAALQNIVNSSLSASNRMYEGLGKRRGEFNKLAQGRATGGTPKPVYQEPSSTLGRLKSFFTGGGAQAPGAPAAPQAPGGFDPNKYLGR